MGQAASMGEWTKNISGWSLLQIDCRRWSKLEKRERWEQAGKGVGAGHGMASDRWLHVRGLIGRWVE